MVGVGRVPGSVNKSTQAVRDEVARSGKSMLEILIDNARALNTVVERFALNPTNENAEAVQLMLTARAVLSQVADRAAKYLHAPQMAIKHEHTMVDGKPIRPVIEITGYPAPKAAEPAPPLPKPEPVVPIASSTETTRH